MTAFTSFFATEQSSATVWMSSDFDIMWLHLPICSGPGIAPRALKLQEAWPIRPNLSAKKAEKLLVAMQNGEFSVEQLDFRRAGCRKNPRNRPRGDRPAPMLRDL